MQDSYQTCMYWGRPIEIQILGLLTILLGIKQCAHDEAMLAILDPRFAIISSMEEAEKKHFASMQLHNMPMLSETCQKVASVYKRVLRNLRDAKLVGKLGTDIHG